jgi:hypothetical protein
VGKFSAWRAVGWTATRLFPIPCLCFPWPDLSIIAGAVGRTYLANINEPPILLRWTCSLKLDEPGLSTMMASQYYVRSDSVVSRVIAGETLVVPVRGSVGDLASIYSLNSVGSTIWQALERPKEVDELTGLVECEYEVTSNQARQDVTRFLAEMHSVGLVLPAEASAEIP